MDELVCKTHGEMPTDEVRAFVTLCKLFRICHDCGARLSLPKAQMRPYVYVRLMGLQWGGGMIRKPQDSLDVLRANCRATAQADEVDAGRFFFFCAQRLCQLPRYFSLKMSE